MEIDIESRELSDSSIKKRPLRKKRTEKGKTKPRTRFEVTVYAGEQIVGIRKRQGREIIHVDHCIIPGRNAKQAAVNALSRANRNVRNHEFTHVVVNNCNELKVFNLPLEPPITGMGCKQSGAADYWARIDWETLRELHRQIPDKSAGAFVTAAINEKLERDMAELMKKTSEFQ